ncbi:TPA: ead/Ea22-like family protein [Klebsiella pneumoniae]|nr:ead/Ea22-like family protein [Klebsiella pneumoniae]HCB3164075.1 ead/Ea22-like family protein [Klebsiella pneumoniae]
MTDITELAQRVERIISDMKLKHGGNDTYAPVMKWDEFLALVKALEKAQTINAAAEKLVRCKGRYHSEQNYRSLAALFGVTTPDLPPLEHENVHYADAAEMEIAALRQRIAELESRAVKLPDLRQIVSGDRYVWSDGVYNYSQDVKVVLAAAGIKVEAE